MVSPLEYEFPFSHTPSLVVVKCCYIFVCLFVFSKAVFYRVVDPWRFHRNSLYVKELSLCCTLQAFFFLVCPSALFVVLKSYNQIYQSLKLVMFKGYAKSYLKSAYKYIYISCIIWNDCYNQPKEHTRYLTCYFLCIYMVRAPEI